MTESLRPLPDAALPGRIHTATLTSAQRITPADSPEEVLQLAFRCHDLGFDGKIGQCIRVHAPGQFGNRYHTRLYALADVDRTRTECTDFTICVRRCFTIDDFNGERYAGVASGYLCDLPADAAIEFSGPVGYPFTPPRDRQAALLMFGMGTGIAPFRGLVRAIYEEHGGWQGPVRLFYGARSGLEMLYMNDKNRDLANYFDQPTFKAFQAVSPRPHFGEPVALEAAIAQHAEEVWSLLQAPGTHAYVAGSEALLGMLEAPLAKPAGSPRAVRELRTRMVGERRWIESLYS